MPTQTKEHPILFSADMIRALLDGRKHQTRRVMTKMLVDVPRKVRGDVPGYGALAPGRHKAVMNKLGAVSCDLGNGKLLGLKPGEFDWVCPYCEGETECTESGWVIRPKETRLWVKETHAFFDDRAKRERDLAMIYYRADDQNTYASDGLWTPSIFMPRWASRLSLEVVSVRVQRLQAISEEDALAEGLTIENLGYYGPRNAFKRLWDSINAKRAEGKYAWSANPWLWAITFKRV